MYGGAPLWAWIIIAIPLLAVLGAVAFEIWVHWFGR